MQTTPDRNMKKPMDLIELTAFCQKFLQDFKECTEEDERSDVVQQFIEDLQNNK